MTGKTIVYLPNWLGDMVMAIPFLSSLRASIYGELWGIGKSNAIHIYSGHNFFDRFVPLESKNLITFLDTITFLKRFRFKRGILLPHSFRSALLFYLAGISERAGYARNKRGFMLTHRVAEDPALEPTMEHYLKIIDILGGRRIIMDVPSLIVTEDEEQKFNEKYIDINKSYTAFVVGAQYGSSKCWPPRHFSELADMIIKRYGMKVYILPGKGEEELAGEVYAGSTQKEGIEIKSMGIRDLKVCLSHASAVVTNDTGPRHISAALSVPTVALLGPMDERYTAYPSTCTHTISADVPCRPCNKKKCDRDHECLKGIRPETVFTKLEEILG
ncbi:MAG: lipopolysaccharide heptosyltransferase II [Proteobacteria bacterium]|nr:lipopolysaccharide heptosyltransferase II [Pseudomonadota bacterium]